LPTDQVLSGWGRTAPSRASVTRPLEEADVARALGERGPRGVVARGLGRAYGDAAQNGGGAVLDMTALRQVHDVDVREGRVTVDAGLPLDELIRALLPFGWFPRVLPGTGRVTVGGAIASDIHGKNHHREGNFTDHVESFELLTPGGETVTVTREGEPELFAATAGGMGLTGVVLRATLRLLRVQTSWMREDVERARDLDDVMSRMESGDDNYHYSVAWIDCLARGSRLGRSVLLRADHASLDELAARHRERPLAPPGSAKLAAPPWAPNGLLNRGTIKVFNELFYRGQREGKGKLVPVGPYFFPLDVIRGWNRMYGSRGFLQYQFAVPFGAEDALRESIERLSSGGAASFLAVLKRFGPGEGGPLCFRLEGWMLALDLAASAPGLGPLLDELDELVAEAGGRVYLSKDSRLRPDVLEAMYPKLGQWRELRERLDPEGAMRSDLGRRLGLVAPVRARSEARA
jgi:decaprenylphospho-beta-D-ribofuranose 2-oxidase